MIRWIFEEEKSVIFIAHQNKWKVESVTQNVCKASRYIDINIVRYIL